MQKKVLGILLALTVLLCMLPLAFSASAATAVSACAHTSFTDGVCDGCGATEIATADALVALMNIDEAVDLTVVTANTSTDENYVAAKAALTKSYVLTADIDLGAYANQTPIGMYASANSSVTGPLRFTGTFDGNGHTVYGVNIDSTNTYVGFFGALASPAVIEDLTIAGPKNSSTLGTISGAKRVGGIAGYAANGITIKNCTVKCNVTATTEYAGGIIAEINTATAGIAVLIEDCENYGVVDAVKSAGGIVGYLTSLTSNSTMTINNCVNHGAVNSESSYAGGILASLGTSGTCALKAGATLTISGCVNNGDVIATQGRIGGIAGSMALAGSSTNYDNVTITIKQCTNTGDVTGGGTGVAGIMGYYSHKKSNNMFEIIQCHNSGDISSTQDVGGIAGYMYTNVAAANGGLISECWNSGSVEATSKYAGGIVGLHYYFNVYDCLNTGNVTDTGSTPGGISARINGSSVNKSLLRSYNANGTMGVTGTATSSGDTNFTIEGAYYKAASGVSDSYGGVAYDYETHFGTLNTEGKWTGTTNPMLAYFHPKHTFVNGTCECGATDDCAHDASLTIKAGENGGVAYVCGSCGKNAYLVETALTAVYVETTGKTPLNCDDLATLGTETVPFADFETAMEYAAVAAAKAGSSVTVHIVDDAYVPASYASPEYAGTITITGKVSESDTDKGTLHFDATTRRYYANGAVTFEQLVFASTTADTRIYAQNHKMTMGKGLEMQNIDGTASSDAAASTFKLYLFGGFEKTLIPSSGMNTNLTVRSGNYWFVGGWNDAGTSYKTSGTGILTVGKADANDTLRTKYLVGYSTQPQYLTDDSKVTMVIDGAVVAETFVYETQNGASGTNSDVLFETDLVLKNGASMNVVATDSVGKMDITGATTMKNTKLNLYVDERSADAEAISNLFRSDSDAYDTSITTLKTGVTVSTYVDYCATYLDGGHATSGSIYTEGDACDDACPECGVIKTHTGDVAWVKNGDVYEFVCDACDKAIVTADQPYVYFDCETGSDDADGLTEGTAVATLDKAVERLATTGGKVIFVETLAITEDIDLPEHTGKITFAANSTTIGIRVSKTVDINLNGPAAFEDIIINVQSYEETVDEEEVTKYYTWYICANWNDLSFNNVALYGQPYVIMGSNVTESGSHSETKHVSLEIGHLRIGQFYAVTLGDRVNGHIEYMTANKTIHAKFADNAVIESLWMATTGSYLDSGMLENYHVQVDMHDTVKVTHARTGNKNFIEGTAYIDSLTMNLYDNAVITTNAVPRSARNAKIYISGAADGRTTTMPVSFFVSAGKYVPNGTETLDFTYSSHSFKNGKTVSYNAMYDGNAIIRVKDECEFTEATDNYTTDGQLYACACGRTEAIPADGIYVWPEIVSTADDGTVTVALYVKSNIEFWGINFSVAAEGYTLSNVEGLITEAAEGAEGFTFANGSASMAVLIVDPDNLSGTLPETKIATLTFTKDEGTTASAMPVVTILSAYGADEADLTEQAYAAPVSKDPVYAEDTETTYGGGVVLESEYVLEYTVTVTDKIKADNAYMVFESTDANGYVATATVYPYELRGKLRFQAPGIAAKNMGDEITGTLYYTVEGVTYKAQTKSFNLGDYYNAVMNNAAFAAEEYADLKALLKTMFNYGAAAQTYFEYAVDELSNSILAEEDRVDYTTAEIDANAETSSAEFATPVYKVASANVVLEQRILFGLKFNLADDADAHLDLTKLTFEGSYGTDKTFTITGDKMTINADGQLCFDIDQVAAKDLNEQISGALYFEGEQVSATITFNLECYVTKVLAGDYGDALKAVSKAVLDYSRAAAAWLK